MLSVVIPTFNAGPAFKDVLERLRSQQTDDPVELIIIDSSSTDDTVQLARAAGARTITISRALFNHGLTRNRAIAEATGDTVILMSQDALPADSHLLQNLARNFQDPAVAGVYARHQPYPHHPPHIHRAALQNNGSPTRTESTLTSQQYDSLRPGERFWACRFDNVCSAIRRSVWERIPFPDSDFAEDLAWAKAVLLEGGEGSNAVVYEPAAVVLHSHALRLSQLYARTRRTHRALKELFGLQLLPRARDLPKSFYFHLRSSGNFWHSLVTVLATYHGN